MHQFTFPRSIEILAILLIVSMYVIFPSPLGKHEEYNVTPSPDEVITHARETYSLTECVEEISPRAVLGDSREGGDSFIVYEGNSVERCFPETVFIPLSKNQESTPAVSLSEEYRDGLMRIGTGIDDTGEMQTSVTVVPISELQFPSAQVLSAASSTTIAHTDASSTAVVSAPSASEVSFGGGGPVPMPTIDRFEFCRKEVFGERIPEHVTGEEALRMEACLKA